MKTLVLSMISIAATVAAMTACTSESDGIDNVVNDEKVEIEMSAKVLNIETRSAGVINGTTNAIDHIAFVKKEAAKDATITWAAETPISAEMKAGGEIDFTPDKIYYPAKEDQYAYLVGYHPSQDAQTISADGKVPFTITGNEDIMYAGIKSGNKNTTVPLDPNFAHKLSQLIIKIEGDAAAAAAWGNITKISVDGISKELELALADGALAAKTGTTASPLALTLSSGKTYGAIPATATEIGYCMILPQNTQHTLLVTTDNYTNKEVSITIPGDGSNRAENETKAGESYTVKLTFTAKDITAKATVDTWKEVTEEGSGSVE